MLDNDYLFIESQIKANHLLNLHPSSFSLYWPSIFHKKVSPLLLSIVIIQFFWWILMFILLLTVKDSCFINWVLSVLCFWWIFPWWGCFRSSKIEKYLWVWLVLYQFRSKDAYFEVLFSWLFCKAIDCRLFGLLVKC